MRQLITDFDVVPADVDEESLTLSDPWETAKSLSLAKASLVNGLNTAGTDTIVIGADTVVAVSDGGQWIQLAKPSSEADAARMLQLLSGKEHVVITGISVVHGAESQTYSETTSVTFRNLSNSEIVEYVATREPMDKAGAYAIQGGAANFVKSIRGSRNNVIGLPLSRLKQTLAQFGLMQSK